jgi:serine protease Do
MNGKNLLLCGVVMVLGAGLIALPSTSKALQEPAVVESQEVGPPPPPGAPNVRTRVRIVQSPEVNGDRNMVFSLADEGGSWLGLETQEVTGEKAKDLKLSAERGVLVVKVLEDSPAAKAGLKDSDVITAVNGQRVEGTAQFRRMIREIPAGRAVELGVWRDGREQKLTATLGKMQENRRAWGGMSAMPEAFKMQMPEMPEIAPMPGVPSIEWDNGNLMMNRPRLGIDAEDVSGQLGSYFGAPDGEGILVREVNSGSAAEKAGVKAGDIITSLNGERIHGLTELRAKLSAASDSGKTAKLGILRNKSALTLEVEIPAVKTKAIHKMEFRTKI